MSGESPSYGSIETGESPSYPARKNDSTTKLVTVVLCATAAVMLVRVALRRACASERGAPVRRTASAPRFGAQRAGGWLRPGALVELTLELTGPTNQPANNQPPTTLLVHMHNCDVLLFLLS